MVVAVCVRLCLMFIFVGVSNALTELRFCSRRSVRGSVSSKYDEKLYLDGSDAAVESFLNRQEDTVACTCTVRNGGPQIPKLFVRLRADGLYRSCGKSIEVFKSRGKSIHRFGCVSSDLELRDILLDTNVSMTLYMESQRPSDTQYKLLFEPDGVTADLYVTCGSPVFPGTTSSSASTSSSDLSSTSPLLSTMSTTVSNNKDNTGIMVGAPVSSATVIIVIIVVWIVCIRNRKKNRHCSLTKGKAEENSTNKEKAPYTNLHTGDSHIYDSIRSCDIRSETSLSKYPDNGTRTHNVVHNSTQDSGVYLGDGKARHTDNKETAKQPCNSTNENTLYDSEGYLKPMESNREYIEVTEGDEAHSEKQ